MDIRLTEYLKQMEKAFNRTDAEGWKWNCQSVRVLSCSRQGGALIALVQIDYTFQEPNKPLECYKQLRAVTIDEAGKILSTNHTVEVTE